MTPRLRITTTVPTITFALTLGLGLALGGCLTEADWEAHAAVMGGTCPASGARACDPGAANPALVLACVSNKKATGQLWWDLAQTCKQGEECVAGACVCPSGACGCTPGETACDGTTLRTCGENRDWSVKSCLSLCNPLGYNKVTGCGPSASKGKDDCQCGHDGRIGDPCSTSAECKVGTCNGLWCQKECKTFQECGTNSLNSTNWCLTTKGTTMACFPSCYASVGSTACSIKYAGTTCQATKTPTGTAVNVCAL